MSHFLFLYLLCSINGQTDKCPNRHATSYKYGQHYGPGSTCTSGWQQQQGRGVRHRQAAVSESDCQLRPASRRGNTHLASQNAWIHKYTVKLREIQVTRCLHSLVLWQKKNNNKLCLIRKKTLQCAPILPMQGSKPFDCHESPNFQIQKLHPDVNSSSTQGSI